MTLHGECLERLKGVALDGQPGLVGKCLREVGFRRKPLEDYNFGTTSAIIHSDGNVQYSPIWKGICQDLRAQCRWALAHMPATVGP
jgi:hypothetical protein